jgi:hypothetical protein
MIVQGKVNVTLVNSSNVALTVCTAVAAGVGQGVYSSA